MDERSVLIQIPKKPQRHDLDAVDKTMAACVSRPVKYSYIQFDYTFRVKTSQFTVIVGTAGDYLVKDYLGNYRVVKKSDFDRLFTISGNDTAERNDDDEENVDADSDGSGDDTDTAGVPDSGTAGENERVAGADGKRRKHSRRTKARRRKAKNAVAGNNGGIQSGEDAPGEVSGT